MAAQQPPCPACSSPMTAHPTLPGIGCPSCHGLWIQEESLRAHLESAGVPIPGLDGRDPDPSPRRCPACGGALAPVAMAGVPLDRCEAHGLWLDHAELDAVAASSAHRQRSEAASDKRSGLWDALKDLLWFSS